MLMALFFLTVPTDCSPVTLLTWLWDVPMHVPPLYALNLFSVFFRSLFLSLLQIEQTNPHGFVKLISYYSFA